MSRFTLLLSIVLVYCCCAAIATSSPSSGTPQSPPRKIVNPMTRLYRLLTRAGLTEEDLDDDSYLQKRQYDDYGHMRFGKRQGKDFDDYGHLRFGK